MHSPFSPYNLYPGMVANVEAAYARNLELGLVADDEFASAVSTKGLIKILQSKVQEERAKGNIDGGFEVITNPYTRYDFETTLQIQEQLFERIDLSVPTPEEFAQSGVDLADLGSKYEIMQADGLEPDIVIAPTLDIATWKELYKDLSFDPEITSVKLKGGGLYINDELSNNWSKLSGIPDDVPTVTDTTGPNAITWTMRLIPGTNNPTQTLVTQRDNGGRHPTVNEYLALQAGRMEGGDDVVDKLTYTWLNGRFSNGEKAPMGRWSDVTHGVRIDGSPFYQKYGFVGSRLPME